MTPEENRYEKIRAVIAQIRRYEATSRFQIPEEMEEFLVKRFVDSPIDYLEETVSRMLKDKEIKFTPSIAVWLEHFAAVVQNKKTRERDKRYYNQTRPVFPPNFWDEWKATLAKQGIHLDQRSLAV